MSPWKQVGIDARNAVIPAFITASGPAVMALLGGNVQGASLLLVVGIYWGVCTGVVCCMQERDRVTEQVRQWWLNQLKDPPPKDNDDARGED